MTAASKPRRRQYGRRFFKPLPPLQALPVEDVPVRSDEHLAQRLLQASGKDQLDARILNNTTGVYRFFAKAAKDTRQGHGRTQKHDIAKAHYPDIETPEDAAKKFSSIDRHLQRLRAAGVLQIEEDKGEDGESRGLYWKLVDEPIKSELYPHQGRRPCSSTGRAADS